MIPKNTVGIMDRGFASWEFLDQMSQTKTLFVVRIKYNMKTKLDHQRYRMVWFCDLDSRMEIPLFYRHRLLDKFRYLQLELSLQCSIIHWNYDLLPEMLV